jgi:hypothetical protein
MAADSAGVVVTRWVARVWSILGIFAALMFVAGEIMQGSGPRPTPQEWVGLALWPIGVGVGLILAWRREKLGGFLTLGCLAAFYGWDLLRSGRLPRGPFFFLLAAPGLLFLLAGFLSNRRASRET